MSDRHELDDQPRKRPRLTEPEADDKDNAEPVGPSADELVQAQLDQERKFGITAFASSNTGFSGIVKQRYTDFLVNEISQSGQVLHLESLGEPKKQQRANGHAEKVGERKEERKKEEVPEVKQPPQQTSEESKDANNSDLAQSADPSGLHPSRAAAIKAGDDEELSNEQKKDVAIASIPAEDKSTIESIFGEKVAHSVFQLYGKIVARPDRKARDYGNLESDVIEDKEVRTNAHVAVRRIFQGRIETTTGDNNCITIKALPTRQKIDSRGAPQRGDGPKVKGKVGWQELGGEHLHFTLYKENKDTMEVLFFLASQTKLHIRNFQMAGTKDRRGVTVQRISVYRMTKERLESFNPRLRQSRIGDYKYEPRGLELGDLNGNEFTITLRDCQAPGNQSSNTGVNQLERVREIISTAVANFESQGYINFYGLQRFGTFATSTSDIGKLMLQGNLKGAVDGILAFSPDALAEAENPTEGSKISSDDLARASALDMWKSSQKMGAAIDRLPKKFQAESAIIKHLGRTDKKSGKFVQPEDYRGALSQIARNLRLMYVHAYQSLVWNSAAAQRLQTLGARPVEGDLVLVHEHDLVDDGADGAEEVDDEGEVIVRPAVEDSAAALDEKFERARPITANEAQKGRFSIFDIVLPLPGFDVEYPKNSSGEFYKQSMVKDNLNPYDMRRSWKDVSLSGGYRKLMSRPVNVSYEVKEYTTDDEQLVQTDLERLQAANGMEATGAARSGAEKMEIQGAPKIALVLKMQLGSSQYATMALRELTKGGALGYKPDFSGR